nr:ribonuclease H-like domain-containing protein [Tanacetum cinerariifolium]
SQSPNDEEGDSSTEDGSAEAAPIQNEGVVPLATQIKDNVTSEGNNLSFSIGGGSGLSDVSQTEVRRSSRPKSQPVRFNDCVVSSNVTYGKKTIGSKWIYRIKYKASGEIDRYKASLVAQGFDQKEGLD